MKHFTIIYNPAAGQGRAGDRLPEVKALLDAANVDYTLTLTESRGHAIELAASAARESNTTAVIAAGGDGTANEVLNGLMQVHDSGAAIPGFGVLCVGRGNDFAYGAGIPTNYQDGIQTLVTGELKPIDVGYLKGGIFPQGRYFGNGIGIGFDTIVGFEAAKMKWIKGFAGYLIGAFKTLFFYYKPLNLTMTTDAGEESRPCIQVSVMNGRRMGGAFYMAPEALTDDGKLDLCIAGSPNRRQMLSLILRYLKGSQKGHEHIAMGQTRKFSVHAEAPLAIHADGETVSVEDTSLEVEVRTGCVRILRPIAGTDSQPS